MGALQEDITGLASRIPCAAVTIIVESSQRADPILKRCFGELKPDGIELTIPVNHCLMPKSGAEPGLEIADFIISAAGSQVRRHLRGQQGPAPDFPDFRQNDRNRRRAAGAPGAAKRRVLPLSGLSDDGDLKDKGRGEPIVFKAAAQSLPVVQTFGVAVPALPGAGW